jgi:hypothetical protein
MTPTDNELALLASQRLPGFETVRVIASELREARKRVEYLEAELQRVKAAATYGAKMVQDFYREPGFTVAPLKEIRMIREVEVK